MKRWLLIAAMLATPVAAKPVVIENVNVVPMHEETLLADRDVFIDEGRITRIVKHAAHEIPSNAVIVSGEGRYLVPGLAEMHSHLAGPGSHFRIEDVLALYIANGVTFVRGMAGHATHVDVMQRVESGEIPGPRLMLGSPPMGGWNTQSIEDARKHVAQAAEHGFALVKLHEQLAPEVFDAIIKAAAEYELLTGGHVSDAVGAGAAVQAGLGTIDHMDNFFEEGIPPEQRGEQADFFGISSAQEFERERFGDFVDLLTGSKTAVVPTFTLFENLLDPELSVEALSAREEMRFAPPAILEQWRQAKQQAGSSEHYSIERAKHSLEERRWMLRELHRRGVPILNGADSPQIFNVPGFATHHELAAYVNAGLSPYEALYTATVAVGEYLGNENHGLIREGAHADLVLVADNPLEDISTLRKPEAVMVRGQLFMRDELEELLEGARSKE